MFGRQHAGLLLVGALHVTSDSLKVDVLSQHTDEKTRV
jgi:hypothetical protein